MEIFCSYADADEAWMRKLETHLSLLSKQGIISLWHRRHIVPGTDWAHTIDTHLETASIILLLVSDDFFASNYCYGTEMRRALERHEAGEARVVPLLVRPVDWEKAPFAHLLALPTDAKPLSSWKNKDAALKNVAAGIRSVLEDLSASGISAPRTTFPRLWNIPHRRNPFFLGRESELAQVRQWLHADRRTALSQPPAISGLGGIGKTQVALEYAYRYYEDYTAVLWARAETLDALISSYLEIASLLRLPEHDVGEQEVIVQAVNKWLQTHHKWLLILDNADELKMLSDFLPSHLGGHLLLTTRATATGQWAHRLEIEALGEEHGALLLLRSAHLIDPDANLSSVPSQERELALRISRELGGLPLALDQAGAYLEENGTNLSAYWQIYQQHRADLLQQRGELAHDHPQPVSTTWSLSFQRVEEKNPAAADLLRLCAFFSPDAIPEEIFEQGAAFLGSVLAPVVADTSLFNQIIKALLAYSLVRRARREKILVIHRLVQAVLQDMLKEAERHALAERVLLAVNAVFPHAEHGTWSQCERLLPHALLAISYIDTYQIVCKEGGHLLYETAFYLQDRARYEEAKRLYKHALQVFEQVLGTGHLDVAYTLCELSNVYSELGQYEEAETSCERSLHIFEQQLGAHHPHTTSKLNNLAILFKVRGKPTEAEHLYMRSLDNQVQILFPEHATMASLLKTLATFSNIQNNADEVKNLTLRCSGVEKTAILNFSRILNNLAVFYAEQGRKYETAERLFQLSLWLQERCLEPGNPVLASSLNNLANLYTEWGSKYVEAQSSDQRALYEMASTCYQYARKILEQSKGTEHPDVAYSLNGLGILRFEQGKQAEAQSLTQRACYEEAKELFQKSQMIWEQRLGVHHPQVAYALYNLANLYTEQNKRLEAIALYQRSLDIWNASLGHNHPHIHMCRKKYAEVQKEEKP